MYTETGQHANDILDEKLAGIFVQYSGISGESEFACSVLIPYTGDVPVEKAVDNYFSDFFGEGTERGQYFYISQDDCEAVKIHGWKVVPQADYAVLKNYL